jgi:hypothetical protein
LGSERTAEISTVNFSPSRTRTNTVLPVLVRVRLGLAVQLSLAIAECLDKDLILTVKSLVEADASKAHCHNQVNNGDSFVALPLEYQQGGFSAWSLLT